MSFLTRLFKEVKKNSSITVCPKDFRQLINHDDYDTYLFECAKVHIESLRNVINLKADESTGFETLLRDVFAMCYKAELVWEENVENDHHYDSLKNFLNDPVWPELRKKTRFNGLLSAMATVTFAQEYQRCEQVETDKQSKAEEDEPRKLRIFEKINNPVTSGVQKSNQSYYAFAEIERHVGLQNDRLSLWGITTPMLPQEPERVMELAGLLEKHPEFLQFAEKVGQLQESLVCMGKKKLRQKGVRLRGVSVGNNIVQAVPSELALLGDLNSEAIFYDRALGGKLTLYDYAVKSEHKKGSMVIVIDGSGSVRGEKGYMIRGVAVALVQLARVQKRWASVIIFGSSNEQREFIFDPHDKVIADRLVEMATTFYGGDTIFWEPLELAFGRLDTKHFRHGDLVLVTDYIQGDEGSLSAFTERFAQAKIKLGFRYLSLFLPSDRWPSDLSWHSLADHSISLDTTFFNGDSSLAVNKLVSFL